MTTAAPALAPRADAEDRPDLDVRWIPLEELRESKWNPRSVFDPKDMADLTESIRNRGQLVPGTVRPAKKGGGFEIGAGARRYRACRAAGRTVYLAIVRDMDDESFLELIATEMKNQVGLHELDEAKAYANLMQVARQSAEQVAARIELSPKYVYDRVKLLELITEAQKIFRGEDPHRPAFSASHAIIIARESPQWQVKLISPQLGALYERAHSSVDELGLELPLNEQRRNQYKVCSVRELMEYVAKHCRFDEKQRLQTDMLPETVTNLKLAAEREVKIVEIRFDTFIDPDAKDPKQKSFGASAWKKVSDDRLCDYWKVGVVRAGTNRGQSFKVCTSRDRCSVHWKTEAAAAQRRKKKAATTGSGVGDSKATAREAAARKQADAERVRQEKKAAADRARWTKAIPVIREALAARIKQLPAKAGGPLAALLVKRFGHSEGMARGKSAEDLVRYLAYQQIAEHLRGQYLWAQADFTREAAKIGLAVDPILAKIAAAEKKVAAPGRAKGAPKAKAKKKK